MKTIKSSENKIRKHRSRFLVLFHLFIVLLFGVNSQINAASAVVKKGIISGKVCESETESPLQYAQVALYSASDSSLVDGTITNGDGDFIIEKIPFGKYYFNS